MGFGRNQHLRVVEQGSLTPHWPHARQCGFADLTCLGIAESYVTTKWCPQPGLLTFEWLSQQLLTAPNNPDSPPCSKGLVAASSDEKLTRAWCARDSGTVQHLASLLLVSTVSTQSFAPMK